MFDLNVVKKDIESLQTEIKKFENEILKAKTLKDSHLKTLKDVYKIEEAEIDTKITELDTQIKNIETSLEKKVIEMKEYSKKLSEILNG